MIITFFRILAATAPLWSLGPSEADAYLENLWATHDSFDARLTAIARDSIGTPYAAGPLGEGPGGTYDADPLIDLSRVDCVTFMEQTIAMAASPTYDETVALLQRIRYEDGQIDFLHRNHFMVADWLANNPWCRDVTQELGVPTTKSTRIISKKAFFPRVGAPDLGQDIPDVPHTIHYIAPGDVSKAVKKAPLPAMVLLVGKIDWLFILHTGLLVESEGGGEPAFIHASTSGAVTETTLPEYLKGFDRFLGVMIAHIDEPK
jgi:D-alanyl-D-alanine carboxypeptidase/D-alanyl-D-alanine-endopeptidase (penicillin-binding protein 4)